MSKKLEGSRSRDKTNFPKRRFQDAGRHGGSVGVERSRREGLEKVHARSMKKKNCSRRMLAFEAFLGVYISVRASLIYKHFRAST